MSGNTIVVKHSGKSEIYNSKKLSASIETAAHSVGLSSGVASDIATKTVAAVAGWLHDKTEVTSDDIRRVAAREIQKFSAEAGYLYQNQKEML